METILKLNALTAEPLSAFVKLNEVIDAVNELRQVSTHTTTSDGIKITPGVTDKEYSTVPKRFKAEDILLWENDGMYNLEFNSEAEAQAALELLLNL